MKLLDAHSWFYRFGILALLGAAITVSFIVDFAAKSPAPGLITSASLTAVFLSLSFIQRKKKRVIAVLVLAVASAIATFLQLSDIVRPSAVPMPPIPMYLTVFFSLTIASAFLALVFWLWSGKGYYNPQITLVQNGVTLIGVLASAIAFNLPTSWNVGIGWAVIAVTLIALEPIWKSEDAAAARLASLKQKVTELEAQLQETQKSGKRRSPRIINLLQTFGWKRKKTKS